MKPAFNWKWLKTRKAQQDENKRRGWSWDFETNDEQTEFILHLETEQISSFFLSLLVKADIESDDLKEKATAQLKEKPFIKVDERYYKLINRALTKDIRKIAREVAADGIKILNTYVEVAYYEKINDDRERVQIRLKGFCLAENKGVKR